MRCPGWFSLFSAASILILAGCGDSSFSPQIEISVGDAPAVSEGDTGNIMVFTVSVTAEPSAGSPVSVDYATSDGTATTADGDYSAESGTLTFNNGGSLAQTIFIAVHGDTDPEADETVQMGLSNPVNGVISDGSASGTILNDDPTPGVVISVDDASVSEGDSGSASLDFTVTISDSPASNCPVTVDYATSDGTATTAGNDYTTASGTLTFNQGDPLNRTVSVTVSGDTDTEDNETLYLDLSSGVNATIGDSQGEGLILNDDPTGSVTITISDCSQAEGHAAATAYNFTLTISALAAENCPISVDWASQDDSATVADGDYDAANGTVTWTSTDGVNKMVTVVGYGDTDIETDERFFVNLANPVNAAIADAQAVGTILNDDAFKVDPTGDGSDGLTWPTAFNTVQEGVDAAGTPGGEVWVAAATYTNSGGSDSVLVMKSGVDVYGGFQGYDSGLGAQETHRSQRDWMTYNSTLDGNNLAYHVVEGAENARLDGFFITAGRSSGSGAPEDHRGGGMYNNGVSPVVANCLFISNYGYSGGGICNYPDAAPLVVNCVFDSNDAQNGGGACNHTNSSPVYVNCLFTSNTAVDGGGSYCRDSSPATYINCTFSANSADNAGGGLYHYDAASSPSIDNCIIWGNTDTLGYPEICNCGVAFPSIGYSDVGGSGGSGAGWDTSLGTDEGGNIDADPVFFGYFELDAGSPCIDAGDNTAVPADNADIDDDGNSIETTPVDINHEARFQDVPSAPDTGNGSPPIVDIGCCEAVP